MVARFIEVDLKQSGADQPALEKAGEKLILAFWGDRPVGWAELETDEADQAETFEDRRAESKVIQLLTWELWQLALTGNLPDVRAQQPQQPISVIVCTRDRKSYLERCLNTLKRQDYPDYEVVVVDNGSSDPTISDLVQEFDFRCVREDRQGLDWARNRGIQAATHDIIAFIDDDAAAPPGWLRGVAMGFSDPEVMLVTGLVLPAEMETPAQFDFETYGGMGKGFYRFTVRPENLTEPQKFWASSWGVGANMAFRRKLVEEIGGFDAALDVGTPSGGGGDIEFFYRAVEAGCTLRYEPLAWLRHFHRRDCKALERQIYNNGRSFPNYLLTIARNQPQKRPAVLRFAAYHWLWNWLLRRLLLALVRGDRRTLRLAWIELKGSFSALPSYWRSQQLKARLSGTSASQHSLQDSESKG